MMHTRTRTRIHTHAHTHTHTRPPEDGTREWGMRCNMEIWVCLRLIDVGVRRSFVLVENRDLVGYLVFVNTRKQRLTIHRIQQVSNTYGEQLISTRPGVCICWWQTIDRDFVCGLLSERISVCVREKGVAREKERERARETEREIVHLFFGVFCIWKSRCKTWLTKLKWCICCLVHFASGLHTCNNSILFLCLIHTARV